MVTVTVVVVMTVAAIGTAGVTALRGRTLVCAAGAAAARA